MPSFTLRLSDQDVADLVISSVAVGAMSIGGNECRRRRHCSLGYRAVRGALRHSSLSLMKEKSVRRQINHPNGFTPMRYYDYKCFRFSFDSGIAFVSIDHPPINVLDEVLSSGIRELGSELEADDSVRVVVLLSSFPDFFIAHSGLSRVGAAAKTVSSYAQLSSYTDYRREIQEYA